jgi:hypothetical protein
MNGIARNVVLGVLIKVYLRFHYIKNVHLRNVLNSSILSVFI